MKTPFYIALLALSCVTTPVPTPTPAPVADINPAHARAMVSVVSKAQPLTVIQPPTVPPIKWVWNAGNDCDYYVVVTATNLSVPLSKWTLFCFATNTTFAARPTDGQRYFTLYGTNSTGQGAWIKQ